MTLNETFRATLALFSIVSWSDQLALADGVRWSSVNPTESPSARFGAAMGYDGARRVAILFGGYDASSGFLGDTWEWDGTNWLLRATSGPFTRREHAMVVDSNRGIAVLYGGYVNGYLADTWEWDGFVWTQQPVSGPGPLCCHAMTFDSARGVVVLFGGSDGNGPPSGKTWEWNGTTWALRADIGPSPRVWPAMAFDTERGVAVLFGGYDVVPWNGETWEWDGTSWTLRSNTGPSPRYHHSMAYDRDRRVVVLFGGEDAQGADGETWEWAGNSWNLRMSAGPSPRRQHTMTYDKAHGVTMLFGGGGPGFFGDTWNYFPDCNSNGTPDLQELVLPGVLLDASFETELPFGWTSSGLWHVTDACAVAGSCDPTRWAYFGFDTSCTFDNGARVFGVLSAPSVTIPPDATSTVLTYCSLYHGESGIAPTGRDAAWVSVNGVIVDDVGFTKSVEGVWESRAVELDEFVGEEIAVCWSFDSANGSDNNEIGWQIDEVVVVAEGVVENDCNSNGVPDECDIASGTSLDFDGDGLVDPCDPDIDNDGVPNDSDVCDFTPAGASIQPDGGLRGDINGDCAVDLLDFSILQEDFTGPRN